MNKKKRDEHPMIGIAEGVVTGILIVYGTIVLWLLGILLWPEAN